MPNDLEGRMSSSLTYPSENWPPLLDDGDAQHDEQEQDRMDEGERDA